MDENEFEGKLLGNIEELYGSDSMIEINESEFHNRNIELTINTENHILCSAKLSDYIRENTIHYKTNELKKFAVYEFPSNKKYVIYSTDSNLFQEREKKLKEVKIVFMDFFTEYIESIKNISLSKAKRLEIDKLYEEKKEEKKIAIEKINKEYEGLM